MKASLDPRRLQECVARLAVAVAKGECTPTRLELQALAAVCDDHHLPVEAARVRRWLQKNT